MRGLPLFTARGWIVLVVLAAATGASATLMTTPPVTTAPVARCAQESGSAPPEPLPTLTEVRPTPPEPPPILTDDELVAATLSIAPNARIGIVIVDRQTELRILSLNADRQFPSASLVKLLIALDVLSREPRDLAAGDAVTRMLSESDDAIASRLWVAGGGGELVRRWATKLDLTGTEPPSVPGKWGATSTTPNDVARIYQFVLSELGADHRELIVNALSSAPRRAADGFDQHFGIPRAFEHPWAIKQGWSSTPAAIAVHSTGLVGPGWRYLVVMLTEHPRSASWDAGADAVTAGLTALTPLV